MLHRLVPLALILVSLAAAPAPAPAQPSATALPVSAAERAVVLEALRGSEEHAIVAAAKDDAELWRAVLQYASRETGQRLRSRDVDKRWALQGAPRPLERELQTARTEGRLAQFLNGLTPQSPRYRQLQVERGRYARMVTGGGWAVMPADAKGKPEPEDHGPLLRVRLAAEGYIEPAGPAPLPGDQAKVHAALIEFQRRHGLAPDGKLTKTTLAALNVTAQDRLAQIDANLERWRWLPARLPDDRIEVDVGRAEATLYQAGAPALSMRIIVGDLRHKTPLFVSRVEQVVFNPPWNVPASIASEELMPKEAKNPGYLARNDFVWVDGHLQQKAGPKSALGLYKFNLPSPFGVYLHDTPSRSLFAKTARTLSHGCMRLEKPRELAVILLGRQGVTPERIEAAVAAKTTSAMNLTDPAPLFVNYFTATLDERGRVVFAPDPYGWDAKLIGALKQVD
jgi:L,D-transpeptidase YcbB